MWGCLTDCDIGGTGGLLEYARDNWVTRDEPTPGLHVPDIMIDRLDWFDHFDTAGVNYLSQQQVVRALVRKPIAIQLATAAGMVSTSSLFQAMTIGRDDAATQRLNEWVAEVWPIFADSAQARISRRAFSKSDGLGEAIISALLQQRLSAQARAG